MNRGEVIRIALTFNDLGGTYARHAAVTMASIFENTSSPVCVHVLHDDTLTQRNRAAFEELAAEYGQQLLFHDVSESLDKTAFDLRKLGKKSQLTVGALFRLLMPQILECEKVIYLDCDIVVNTDIAELWNVPLDGKALGAVRDVWSLDCLEGKKIPWRLGKVWDLLGIAHDGYFNSGVLVMDLEKIRAEYDLLGSIGSFFAEYGKCITMEDQDFLNCLFADDKLLLDEKFNRIRTQGVTADGVGGCIWHMASGSAKPWTCYSRPFVDDLYWKYLRKTPYCTSDEELLHTALTDLSASPLLHRHSGECTRRVFRQTYDNIFRAHIWTVPRILYMLHKRARSSEARSL